ncbi:choline dehydrogenase-like flavoprotein [Pedobacter cryoconitis]|uniref:Choline dehydrogenase-like flavoprotein n=1 Tax=Pedobacter cryoconitis TaxID=188932 RepID=A0A7W8ZS06_9SPHI|nr:GMC family oxidoreductase [Pedobacter cryoconitis]MBB5638985.1 choline dehydrogenase-like flavoprotein [Pedobacter cryoconitis]MBB6270802.1 choline dehydrogenase-like flavoprotein [Pedobacter cryoconitis]
MNINTNLKAENTYDAIVVGSGISGGWAAKELTEKGLRVLMLERGENIEHIKDYDTAMKNPWEFKHAGRLTEEQKRTHPVQKRDYPFQEANSKWWVNDLECPYTEEKRFDWYRGFHVGGKSLMWGRQSYRFGQTNFEDNARDGHGADWPIRYDDLAPWYDYAEKFAGISGSKENWPLCPDGSFLPPMDLNIVEKTVKKRIEEKYNRERIMMIGRVANLTVPHKGRGNCQYRDLCSRGCPFGAYFSTQSATLPAAVATNKLTLRPYSIVNHIIYDKDTKKAKGVMVIDTQTQQTMEFYARIVFVNASTLGSTFILLNSTSEAHPNGLGNGSGQLGHNLMDHHFRCGASGDAPGFEDKYTYGRRANGIYIPRYQNIGNDKRDYLRGFGYQGGASRENWQSDVAELSFGAGFKEKMTKPGKWTIGLGGFGEMLPYYENKVSIDHSKKDKWGQPVLSIDCEYKENEKKMRVDMMNDAAEMLEASGMKNVRTFDSECYPGMAIHEMGTARMGKDPETSVLNKWNQMHEVSNVFVTDGSCMPSIACQNPSLTFMALTARACDYAVSEMKKNNL